MKECFKCLETLPLAAFYRHPETADGRLGKCKECTKADCRASRNANLAHYRSYDRQRVRGKGVLAEKRKSYRGRNPEKYKAHMAVNNALRGGRLIKGPCEVCGSRQGVQAHHDDYGKPLEVRWLCVEHHNTHHHKKGL